MVNSSLRRDPLEEGGQGPKHHGAEVGLRGGLQEDLTLTCLWTPMPRTAQKPLDLTPEPLVCTPNPTHHHPGLGSTPLACLSPAPTVGRGPTQGVPSYIPSSLPRPGRPPPPRTPAQRPSWCSQGPTGRSTGDTCAPPLTGAELRGPRRLKEAQVTLLPCGWHPSLTPSPT